MTILQWKYVKRGLSMISRFNIFNVRLSKVSSIVFASIIVVQPILNSQEVARRAFFGDLHMHTSLSLDAYLFGIRVTPDDAYNFAKGRPLTNTSGRILKLHRPLDFLAITDHAEYLGSLDRMNDLHHPISKHPMAERLRSNNSDMRRQAYIDFTSAGRAGRPVQGIAYEDIQSDAWAKIVSAANRHYEPGVFTTFIGFEWSAAPAGRNLHRNVIFKGDAAPLPFSRINSLRPEHLWEWMDKTRSQGFSLLAIPHNSNISNGLMFDTRDSWGAPLSLDRAEQRRRNEPLLEVTQVKGTSETHPSLSPEDEFANFELIEQLVGMSAPVTTFAGGYARDALRRGLELQYTVGVNPFSFGLVGATDSHTGIVTDREDSYSGKIGEADGSPEIRLQKSWFEMDVRRFSASGLTGVWAESNNRDSIFSALERKETWATTGPRILVRLFAGTDLDRLSFDDPSWVQKAYRKGTAMGGELKINGTKAPVFIAWALKDPHSANLDRIQMVKGWLENGITKEKVFDIAWSSGRSIDTKSGRLLPVGNTVNVRRAEYSNEIGAAELSTVWQDPDFNHDQSAFYYLRVLEIPTPRWSTFDAKELGILPPDDLPETIQERAFSSPIWYSSASKQ